MKQYSYLIIGNSAAGIGAVEGIRETDRSGSIAIIADEPEHAYSRALIPFFLMGRLTREGMNFRPRDFYSRYGVNPILGRRAVQVDTSSRRVVLEDGEEIGYGQLLLATGGKPIVPPLPGAGLDGVYTFQSSADVDAVQEALPEVQRAVVIGGGLIGMLAAEALCELGRSVTVVELLPRIMAPVFDAAAAALITEQFTRRGVRILIGTAVTEICPAFGDPARAGNASGDRDSAVGASDDPARTGSVRLNSGEELPADMVIMAVGVAPRVDLARGAGIAVNKGIVVDRRGATSAPGVYAAGDCAEGHDLMTGQTRPMPIWPRAYSGGRIAGLNMAGSESEGTGDIAMNSSHFFGFPAMSAGIHDPSGPGLATHAYEEIRTAREGYYQKLVLRDGRIAGIVLVGAATDRAGILTGLMKEGHSVAEYLDRLQGRRPALISLPEELRRARLKGGSLGA